ncbi:ATP-binding cassette domain-containing protein [Stygiolobus caldivivus]|uniref:AAA+ ATPase domain-containing protein n=1 Tax=Stygiolobus caldivivus TaxID=2824673 RepID=A0A8D5ZJ70_9CREN|nr:ATP-binding cassette domain-containing protein [Stygiolobus caldivivus]BCU69917.1 hypothetical protein KN1_12140 [Stygiolobus caldivivus]
MKVTVRGIGPIKHISFTLDKSIAVVGPNGSGKTTLLLTLYGVINAWAKGVRLKSPQVGEEFVKALGVVFKKSLEDTFRCDVRELVNGNGEVTFQNGLGDLSLNIDGGGVSVNLKLNKEVRFQVREIEDNNLPVGEVQVNTSGTSVEVIYGVKGKEKWQYFDLLRDLLKEVEGSAIVNAFLDFYFYGFRPVTAVGEVKGEVVVDGKKVAITDFGVFIDGKKYPVTSRGVRRLAEILLSSRGGELVLIDDAEAYLDERLRYTLMEEVVKRKKVVVTTRDKAFANAFDNVVQL